MGAGGEGGFIRVGVEFYPDAAALAARKGGRRKGRVPLVRLLVAGAVAAGAWFLLRGGRTEEAKKDKKK